MVGEKSPSIFSKIVTHLLLLYPILNTYLLTGSTSVGRGVLMALVVIFVFRVLIKGQNPLKFAPKLFNSYCFFWLGSALLSIGYIGFSVLDALPGIVYSFLLVLLFFCETDFYYLVKWYKIYAFVFIAFFFVQELMFLSTGIRISGLIPGLPLTVDRLVGTESYMEQVVMGYRSSSVFSEPAHFAQWLLPFLSLELMFDNSKRRIFYSGATVLTLLLLRSGNAVIGLIVVLAFYLGHLFIERGEKFRFAHIMIFTTLLLLGSYYYLNSDAGNDVLDRQEELRLSESGSDRMGQVRLFRGYYVFAEYSFLEQLIGISDIPKLMYYIKSSPAALYFDENETYFNVIQSILLKTGYIGLFLFFLLCVTLSKGNKFAGKAIIWSFFALSFVAGLFFTSTMALCLVLPHKLKQMNYV